MITYEAPVAVLMPLVEPENYPRFTGRYQGLSDELAARSIGMFFAESHKSYDADKHTFRNVFDIRRQFIAEEASASLIRDLTMALDAKPLYQDAGAHQIVHHPDTNRFIANKAAMWAAAPEIHPITVTGEADDILDMAGEVPGNKVIIKPVTGMLSKNVQVVPKIDVSRLTLEPGTYLLQEFLDTSRGIARLNIEGVHNLRILSIGSVAIGAISRVGGSDANILKSDVYGGFVGPDDLPDTMHVIVDKVHEVLRAQPGKGDNVVAIDVMRGIGADGEEKDVLCEVNRRPLRISQWDLRDKNNLDPDAIRTIATKWDWAEAEMLARLADIK